jgi:hypothetical protein
MGELNNKDITQAGIRNVFADLEFVYTHQ